MPHRAVNRRLAIAGLAFVFVLSGGACARNEDTPNSASADAVVLISADAEWRAAEPMLPSGRRGTTPFGGFVETAFNGTRKPSSVVFVRGGWGKVSAAASAQYAIDRWRPKLLVNLGTCGGFEGRIERNTVVLVTRTVIYDISELMGDPAESIRFYTVDADLSWLSNPRPKTAVESVLVSGDRDVDPEDIAGLASRYGAVAADWESGSIAFVASRNEIPWLILRGVSDIVGSGGGEAYGNLGLFAERTRGIMRALIDGLPAWLDASAILWTGNAR